LSRQHTIVITSEGDLSGQPRLSGPVEQVVLRLMPLNSTDAGQRFSGWSEMPEKLVLRDAGKNLTG